MSNDTDDTDDSEATSPAADTYECRATVCCNWKQSGQPSVTIIEAVAAATDRLATDLPPLHGCIDPDALNTLLTRGSTSAHISFTYAGSTVSVKENGTLEIRIPDVPVDDDR